MGAVQPSSVDITAGGERHARRPVLIVEDHPLVANATSELLAKKDTGLDVDAFPEFFGTSAAAPHAAAVAALMLERNPTFTVADLYQTLNNTAIDAETPGVDDLSGAGVINALAALTAMPGPSSIQGDWRLYE